MLIERYYVAEFYDFQLQIGFYLSIIATFLLFFQRLGYMIFVVKQFEARKKQTDLLDN